MSWKIPSLDSKYIGRRRMSIKYFQDIGGIESVMSVHRVNIEYNVIVNVFKYVIISTDRFKSCAMKLCIRVQALSMTDSGKYI